VFSSGIFTSTISPTFETCSFQGNTYYMSSAGSGIRFTCPIVDASGRLEPLFDNCTVTGNVSSGDGGGIYICGQAWNGGIIAPVFTNCTVSANSAGNRGGGVYVNITESSGGQGSADMDLTILYSNCAYGAGYSGNEAWIDIENDVSFSCCDVNIAGVVGASVKYTDLTTGNPAFCEMAFCDTLATLAGDFSLANHSPAAPVSSPCGLQIGAHPVVCGSAVGAGDEPSLPTETALYQNEPNPFNPVTSIRFDLAQNGAVELRIFDVKGRLVRTLLDRSLPRGWHLAQWDGTNDRGQSVASGVYFLRMSTAQKVQTRKLILLK
jgi:hypothetical protein